MKVRASYDERLQEVYQLISTRTTLEAETSNEELNASDEYAKLLTRTSELETELTSVIDGFQTGDFDAAFRDLAPES